MADDGSCLRELREGDGADDLVDSRSLGRFLYRFGYAARRLLDLLEASVGVWFAVKRGGGRIECLHARQLLQFKDRCLGDVGRLRSAGRREPEPMLQGDGSVLVVTQRNARKKPCLPDRQVDAAGYAVGQLDVGTAEAHGKVAVGMFGKNPLVDVGQCLAPTVQ
ncbi:hypothetical protein D3C71_1423990 [compost metagenome]